MSLRALGTKLVFCYSSGSSLTQPQQKALGKTGLSLRPFGVVLPTTQEPFEEKLPQSMLRESAVFLTCERGRMWTEKIQDVAKEMITLKKKQKPLVKESQKTKNWQIWIFQLIQVGWHIVYHWYCKLQHSPWTPLPPIASKRNDGVHPVLGHIPIGHCFNRGIHWQQWLLIPRRHSWAASKSSNLRKLCKNHWKCVCLCVWFLFS